ncbi:MAG TPA: sigma-70 family RNA polymerase sigma factor [Actinomycetota bacterium]|nr:sigma-70 family RNA polymerase sigma factor [Actinomycetota bacterium]
MNAPEVLAARVPTAVGPSRPRVTQEEVLVVVAAADLSDARDRDLLRRIGRRDEDAFRNFFGRYAPTARALALRILRQPFLADETVQEAFLSVWRDPDRYDPRRGSVRAWLMSAVHHRAVDLVRREEAQRRRADRAPADAPSEDPAEQVAEAIDIPEERAAVRAALNELPPEQREVIELMYFEGLSQSRVAERTGIPLGTIKSRAVLGMRRMRSSLGALER